MKKIETHVYEVTPEELKKLHEHTQVLCYDSVWQQYSIIQARNAMSKSACEACGIHYFLFDLPEGYEAV